MDESTYVKSVNRGLLLGGVLGGIASGVAVVIFLLLFVTQGRWLVVWVPVAALAVCTVGTLHLLKRDAAARAKAEKNEP